ncbi:hypothetical protein J4E90_005110, partial [Alternaria incomplexa]|uniref:uncharacterized protein n=1 Tax=Alternaria incomplexa TaxID=1187928 RepID=UPI00221EA965
TTQKIYTPSPCLPPTTPLPLATFKPTDWLMSVYPMTPTSPSGTSFAIVKKSPLLIVSTNSNHTISLGPFTVDIAAESSTPEANPGRPQFLKGITFNAEKEEEWNNTVLPYIRLLTFTVASTTDTYFIGDMLQVLPDIDKNILKVDMNGFHWFSGITDNRSSNRISLSLQVCLSYKR